MVLHVTEIPPKVTEIEQVWVEVLKVSPKKFYISDQMKMKMNHVKNGNIVFT